MYMYICICICISLFPFSLYLRPDSGRPWRFSFTLNTCVYLCISISSNTYIQYRHIHTVIRYMSTTLQFITSSHVAIRDMRHCSLTVAPRRIRPWCRSHATPCSRGSGAAHLSCPVASIRASRLGRF